MYLLLDIMNEKKVSRAKLATILDLSYNSLNLRIKKKIPFKVSEVNEIKKYLELTDAQVISIFFD